MKSVLISGGTGLIGKKLTEALKTQNYEVRILSRKDKPNTYYWDVEKQEIDPKAIENLDYIIHLAGAPISKRWTKSYKDKLYNSRIKSAEFLYKIISQSNQPPKCIITASGCHFYGAISVDKILDENQPHGNDFLGNLCHDLENSIKKFENLGTRVCAVRTAAVLSKKGGMIKEFLPFAKLNLASVFGNGKQIMPWVHINDIVKTYIWLLENDHLTGAFNASSSEIVTNKEFTKTFVRVVDKKIIAPPIPSFLLKILLGEMSCLVLEGSPISNKKLKNSGFQFEFKKLEDALTDLLK